MFASELTLTYGDLLLGFAKSRPSGPRTWRPSDTRFATVRPPGGTWWPSPDFPQGFFCPAVNPRACTDLHQVWACKLGDSEFELFVACCWDKSVFILFIGLFTETNSTLEDFHYWTMYFESENTINNEICELLIFFYTEICWFVADLPTVRLIVWDANSRFHGFAS